MSLIYFVVWTLSFPGRLARRLDDMFQAVLSNSLIRPSYEVPETMTDLSHTTFKHLDRFHRHILPQPSCCIIAPGIALKKGS